MRDEKRHSNRHEQTGLWVFSQGHQEKQRGPQRAASPLAKGDAGPPPRSSKPLC